MQRLNLASLEIESLLLAADTRCGLHGNTKIEFVAVGDAAVYAASVVGGGGAFGVDYGVIVFRAKHLRSLKTAAKLDAFDGRNGKHSVADERLHRIPERLAKPDGQPRNAAIDNAANRIVLRHCALHSRFNVGLSANLADICLNINTFQNFLCHNASRNNAHRYARRKMSAATVVVETLILATARKIGVARTRLRHKVGVVRRVRVRVFEQNGNWRARCVAVENTRHNLGLVGLGAWRGALCAAFATGKVSVKIGLFERDSSGAAVNHHSHLRAVRLAKNAHSENSSESIHNQYFV